MNERSCNSPGQSIDEIARVIQEEVMALSGNHIHDHRRAIFLKSDVIDSINMANLVVALEDRYAIEIDAFFTDRNSVASIRALAEHIAGLLET